MSDLEKLKQLDPQEVFQKTYIAPKVLQQLINQDFSKIGNRAKALGFVTILERELGLDLSELRSKIEEFYGHREDGSISKTKEKEKKSSNIWIVWIVFLLVVGVGIAVYWSKNISVQIESQKKEQSGFFDVNESEENKTIFDSNESKKSVTEMIQRSDRFQKEPSNETNESNSTREMNEKIESNHIFQSNKDGNVTIQKEGAFLPTITIVPKRKIWIGIIYLDNYKRKNYLTNKPIELNTSRDQLIVTGHGFFSIEVDGHRRDLNKTEKVRMLYRAGKIEIIDTTTFKHYNRGKNW